MRIKRLNLLPASDRLEANLFFRLVSARYEKASIILTSNKHARDWPEIFPNDEILTTAILDRLLHHVHINHIDGKSYRLRERHGLLQSQGRARSGSRPIEQVVEPGPSGTGLDDDLERLEGVKDAAELAGGRAGRTVVRLAPHNRRWACCSRSNPKSSGSAHTTR